MFIQGPNRRQPLRRPNHIDKPIDPRSNPLGHRGVPSKSRAGQGGPGQTHVSDDCARTAHASAHVVTYTCTEMRIFYEYMYLYL